MSEEARPVVHVGTGMSGLKDAFEAGKAAATQAVEPLAGKAPELVMVFATPRYDLPAPSCRDPLRDRHGAPGRLHRLRRDSQRGNTWVSAAALACWP